MKLALFQHTWKARDLDPDGTCYGTEAEADAAEIKAARDQIDDFDGDDIAGALDDCGLNLDTARLDAIRAEGFDLDTLTDEEALEAAQALRSYDSAVYPIDVEIPVSVVLAAATGDSPIHGDVSAAAYLITGVSLAQTAVSRWQSGDLAGAVNGLEEWADDVQAAFPTLDFSDDEGDDETESVQVLDVRPGDLVDLEGDPFASFDGFPAAEFEYYTVTGGERESAGCLRLDFGADPSIGFPPDHVLKVQRGEPADVLELIRNALDAAGWSLRGGAATFYYKDAAGACHGEHATEFEAACAGWLAFVSTAQ